MKRRLGIAITRNDATVIGLETSGQTSRVVFTARVERKERSESTTLEELLRSVPGNWQRCEVVLGLSHSLLSCADCVAVPYRSSAQLELVAASLAEGRCAGESAEDLAVDALQLGAQDSGMLVEILAVQQAKIASLRSSIRKLLPHSTLISVGSIAAALARTLEVETCVIAIANASSAEGYAIQFEAGRPVNWRAFPLRPSEATARQRLLKNASELGAQPRLLLDEPVEFSTGLKVDAAFAAATAVALSSGLECANALRGTPDYPKAFVSKFKRSILSTMTAAAVLCVAAGIYFHSQVENAEANLDQVDVDERKLWQQYLPSERPSGALLARMQQKITEHNRSMDANRAPSALAFWAEIGAVLPQPDSLGLTLDTLQLGPDGGRWTGHVSVKPGDPLANAASFERALNTSACIAARGEFEAKESDVQVRMRLDYEPRNAGDPKR